MRTTLALFALAAACLHADEWTRSYSVGATPELDLRVDDANVTVRAGTQGRIEARITSLGYEFRPGDVEIRDVQSGNRVDIEVKRARRQSDWGNNENRWIRAELTVPPQLVARIKTGDGNVEVSGIGGELRFATGDGNIAGENLSGSIDTNTGDGNIRVRGRFQALSANTGDGNIEAHAEAGSQLAASWRFVTGDGNVRLYLPSDLRTTLDVRTGDGKIQNDLPLVNVQASDRQRDDGDLRGDLNGGGPSINVRTGDGNVFLNTYR